MAYNAKFSFNGAGDHKVLDLSYNVSRTVDPTGRITSNPSNASIKMTIEATESSAILESLVNSKFKPNSGKVTFDKADSEGNLVTLEWQNGFVGAHEVKFDASNDKSMTISFAVTAEKVTYGNAHYDGNWPKIA